MKQIHILLILIFPLQAFAGDIYPMSGQFDEPPYLLELYGCDLQNLKYGLPVPIKETNSHRELIVSPQIYSQIQAEALKLSADKVFSDKELKRIDVKITQFEDSGNIEAMKHWVAKGKQRRIEVLAESNRATYTRLADKIIRDTNPRLYHGIRTISKVITKADTFSDLISVTGNSCSAGAR